MHTGDAFTCVLHASVGRYKSPRDYEMMYSRAQMNEWVTSLVQCQCKLKSILYVCFCWNMIYSSTSFLTSLDIFIGMRGFSFSYYFWVPLNAMVGFSSQNAFWIIFFLRPIKKLNCVISHLIFTALCLMLVFPFSVQKDEST